MAHRVASNKIIPEVFQVHYGHSQKDDYQIIADNAKSELSFLIIKLLNNFLITTKTTEFGQVEESRHQVSSSLNPEHKVSAALDKFPKRLSVCVVALS